jgi:hypothetical protein
MAGEVAENFADWKMFGDFDEPPFVNVAIVDPHSGSPVIQLLFETAEPTTLGTGARAACAVFIHGQQALAQSLASQMVRYVATLKQLDPEEIRQLSVTSYVYFAYESNMSIAHLKKRVPSAHRLGPAVLYGWQRTFGVDAPTSADRQPESLSRPIRMTM